MRKSLEQQLGAFLRRKRGNANYKQFARRLGVSESTCFRLEQGQQNATLRMIQHLMDRLRCSLWDIFED
ncbi:MAG TPA: helix-turn-helix transcriptional regulator [Verrucomicrobiae bacterium]